MNETGNWLAHDHSQYETSLTTFREAIEQKDWVVADREFEGFISYLKTHMALEEEILFPAYEAVVGTAQGPTAVLSDEHDKIIRLVQDVAQALKTRNPDHVIGSLVPLEVVMTRHHEKEEDFFLPMASHILISQREQLLQALGWFDESNVTRKWNI